MVPIIFTVAMLLVLPLIFIGTLWKVKFKTRLEWLLDALTTVFFIVWVFQSGAWSWIGYYFRFLLLALLIVALVFSWKKARRLPFIMKYSNNQKFTLGVHGFLLLIFGAYNAFVFTSYSTKDTTLMVDFPLHEGTYYIGQGGNHVQMNYHQAYEPQQYALDILALNSVGTRAKGLYPKALQKYEIFGHPIYSPCGGTVIGMENGLIDSIPPEADPKNATGNYVALTCDIAKDTVIYLAHMQEGSVAVQEGVHVEAGQLLGKVGNTGNTSEPHLHIHAEKNGIGVPLKFHNRFLVRNSLVR
ncbi:M23 family metallopeptidase [Sporosarcina sp. FSL K6-1522]|uniref:M23 family metallopeptidase n=1 Tax=Sporosarcina sp. FSL K6-1522 TaxID=2921554 RepID=UPI00315A714F